MKSNKLFLQIYGLLRMILGLAQIVALTGGYFLTEFVVRWPSAASQYVFDEDILLLIYLAVFIRGIFHFVTGIGIARTKLWSRTWITFGWPVVLIITFGIIYTLAQNWQAQGLINQLSDIISWPQLLTYLAFVGFDYTIVRENIHHSQTKADASEYGVKAGHLVVFSGMIIASFCIVLFLAKPITQGFHQGFYKTKGNKAIKEVARPKTEAAAEILGIKESVEIQTLPNPVLVEKVKVEVESPDEGKESAEKLVAKVKEEPVGKASPLHMMVGFLAALCFIAALIYDMMPLVSGNSKALRSTFFYLLLTLGFFLWIIYGMGLGLVPVYITGIFGSVLCAVLLMLRQKE